VDRFVLTGRLRPDGRQRAEALLAEHSAFGAEELETAFDRHAIFLSETEVIFLVRSLEAGPDGLDLICIGGRRPKGGDTERVPDFWE
jgi:hypothetical protein